MKLKNNLTVESRMQEYASQCFYSNQLSQIRHGLSDNIDVSKYAFIQYDSAFMTLLRELMTFDDAFDMNDYVDNDKFDVQQLLSRHMSITHPCGNVKPLGAHICKYIIAQGPYYVIDKSVQFKKTF